MENEQQEVQPEDSTPKNQPPQTNKTDSPTQEPNKDDIIEPGKHHGPDS